MCSIKTDNEKQRRLWLVCTGNACRSPFADGTINHYSRIVLFNKIALDKGGNVEAPHYQTANIYRNVAQQIEKGCKRLAEKWKLRPPKA